MASLVTRTRTCHFPLSWVYIFMEVGLGSALHQTFSKGSEQDSYELDSNHVPAHRISSRHHGAEIAWSHGLQISTEGPFLASARKKRKDRLIRLLRKFKLETCRGDKDSPSH